MNKALVASRANDKLKTKWLLVDIGDVILLKDGNKIFSELLANELSVSVELAQKVNREHFTTMDVRFITEKDFILTLEKKLRYKAPSDIYSYFVRAYDKQVRPNLELLNFLNEVRALGVKTAILSNTIAIYQEIQEKYGISKEAGFDPILYSWDVGMLKPNKDIFKLALERLKSKPEEIVFIDDKTEHLHGAQQVGIRTILFEDTKSTIKKIHQLNIFEGSDLENER